MVVVCSTIVSPSVRTMQSAGSAQRRRKTYDPPGIRNAPRIMSTINPSGEGANLNPRNLKTLAAHACLRSNFEEGSCSSLRGAGYMFAGNGGVYYQSNAIGSTGAIAVPRGFPESLTGGLIREEIIEQVVAAGAVPGKTVTSTCTCPENWRKRRRKSGRIFIGFKSSQHLVQAEADRRKMFRDAEGRVCKKCMDKGEGVMFCYRAGGQDSRDDRVFSWNVRVSLSVGQDCCGTGRGDCGAG